MAQEVPVYLFLGFLDSGKTQFIQETFEDERFDSGEKTLLLVLEEGEVEYDESRFRVENYVIQMLAPEEMTEQRLTEIAKRNKIERVVVEYNGMLPLSDFFDAMPEGWMIAQVMTFFDATTFLAYNRNMRQQTYDKLQFTDMVVFNRFQTDFSKEEFHKIVRAVSRRPDIVYEYKGGRAEYDEIVDPLPFDIDAKIVEIQDRDYALFYRDLMEDMKKYEGKTVRFKGLVAVDKKLKPNVIVVGRHIMTCCEADIAYSALVVKHASTLPLKTRDWVTLTGRIRIEYNEVYGDKGPVLTASALDYADPPEQEIATFY